MIAIAIGTVVVGLLIMGMFIAYSDDRDRIEQSRGESTEIQGDRIREDVGGELYLNRTMRLTNEWGAATAVTGVMVRCDDGRVITADADIDIPTTGGVISDTQIGDRIQQLRAQCSTPP